MNHDLALNDKHALVDYWSSDEGLYMVTTIAESLYTDRIERGGGIDNEAVMDDMIDRITRMQARFFRDTLDAACYYVAGPIQDFIVSAQKSLPKGTGMPERLPSPSGYIRFERPIELTVRYDKSDGVWEGQPRRLQALMWLPGPHYQRRDEEGDGTPSVMLFGLSEHRGCSFPAPSTVEIWPISRSWDAVEGASYGGPSTYGEDKNLIPEDDLRLFNGLLQTFWSFVEQTLVVAPHTPVSRGTRRRIARETGLQPEQIGVRVVQLRRLAPVARLVGESDEALERRKVEWSCQWAVSGHWRTYAGERWRIQKTIWIDPYMKGPLDAPIKTPDERVFVVAR